MKKYLLLLWMCLFLSHWAGAQEMFDDNNHRIGQNGSSRNSKLGTRDDEEKDKKKKEKIPTGIKTWTVSQRFGVIDSVATDTASHAFQNSNFTEGLRGEYNTLGNMGSPRLSRLFYLRPGFSYFIFADPYDYFITPFSAFHFTNTKSPITNITYHECGNNQNGEDHIKAIYAVNMNKDIGFGFKLDYLYGRGYHNYQATSDFHASLYSSIIKEKYQAHILFYSNYLKTAENGGITDDNYVTNPENFPSKYGTKDIPTVLSKAWNKTHVDGVQLTHRYSLGFRKAIGTAGKDSAKVVPPGAMADTLMHPLLKDSLKAVKLDTTHAPKPEKTLFVPVTSIIHSLTINHNTRLFLANESLAKIYTNSYLAGDSAQDHINNTFVSNQLALELHEGFNKWAMAGIRLFGRHDFNRYSMPQTKLREEHFTENRITVGGQLFKEKGRHIHYSLLAQTTSDGTNWGEFELRGNGRLQVSLLGDTVQLDARANILNQQPTFFFRKYQSKYLWWNNSLDKQMTTHIGGTLSSLKTKTSVSFDLSNIKNYTYFASTATQTVSGTTTSYTTNTEVRQASGNIQVLSITACQDFRLGILNWENQVTYQTTSNKTALPLPLVSAYSNLYLLFRIAKVLRVELGGDVRYFTSYYAPTYSPALGQFCTQAEETQVKVGNYPITNVYVNFHLKHTRFYLMASHVNYSRNGGNSFLVPHYPVNPMSIKFGLSWNFFN